MRLKWFAIPAVLCGLIASTALAQTAPPAPESPPAESPALPPIPVVIPPPVAVPPAPPAKPHLRDTFVYVYSYMDVREDHFGPVMLANMDAKLTADLKALNISAKVVAWKSTDTYQQQLAADEYKTRNLNATNGFRETTAIPVEKVIAEKLADEKASGAKYRLVIFPKNYTSSGAWRYYNIVWNLYDIETNRKVWTYIYNGENLIWWREDENADKRAKKIVDTFMGELVKSGLDK